MGNAIQTNNIIEKVPQRGSYNLGGKSKLKDIVQEVKTFEEFCQLATKYNTTANCRYCFYIQKSENGDIVPLSESHFKVCQVVNRVWDRYLIESNREGGFVVEQNEDEIKVFNEGKYKKYNLKNYRLKSDINSLDQLCRDPKHIIEPYRSYVSIIENVMYCCKYDLRPKDDLLRVLIIGDSISMNYENVVREQLKGQVDVYRPPVNCQSSTNISAYLGRWLGEYTHPDYGWDLIIINCGLWDILKKRMLLEIYSDNIRKITERLRPTNAKIMWITITPILKRKRKKKPSEVEYNEEIKKLKVDSICDVWKFVKETPIYKDWRESVCIHFKDGLEKPLGEFIAQQIKTILRIN